MLTICFARTSNGILLSLLISAVEISRRRFFRAEEGASSDPIIGSGRFWLSEWVVALDDEVLVSQHDFHLFHFPVMNE